MFELEPFFFPDAGYSSIAGVCYALIFLTAYERYNSLIRTFGGYDAPETARPWTTGMRYHSSAVIYSSLYAIFLAVLYQLFHQYPLLVNAARKMIGAENVFGKTLNDIGEDMKLISPILCLILLTWGAEKYQRTAMVDRKLRIFFQRLGSIPAAASRTIRKLKKIELEVAVEECLGNLPMEIKEEITLPLLQSDPKSLEHLYLRACHLFYQIDHWNNISSDFFQFQTVYNQVFKNIRARFEKLNRNANRYFQLKLNLGTGTPLSEDIPEETASRRFDSIYPKILTELRKDLKTDLRSVLENIYIFIACAVHSKGFTAKKRKKLLQSFGFRMNSGNNQNSDGVDLNDLTILAVFLVFVIPLSAVFAGFLGNRHLGTIETVTYVVWAAMALFIGLASVAVPVAIKQIKENSDNAFWMRIRPDSGNAWFAFMISGISAGLTGIFIIFLLNFMTPQLSAGPIQKTLFKILPWGLVPLSIAFVLGYHLDRKRAAGRQTRIIEALSTALVAMLAAVLALMINAKIIKWAELIPKMYFILTCALLIGSIIGAVVPHRYRGRIRKSISMVTGKVDLKETIVNCIYALAERAEKGNVRITALVGNHIPLLKIDSVKIKQAINGLLSNALEFTPAKGWIQVAAGLDKDGGITISVKDNGIGMSSDKIKAIVDAPPEQVHGAWELVDEYHNADLIQIRSIIERHGGRLNLESRQWEGTEISVVLPKELLMTNVWPLSNKATSADLAA